MAESLTLQGQLHNINTMSKEAFLRQKPYLASDLDDRPYVVVNGCRRLAAAPRAGMTKLKHELHDEWTAEEIDRAVVSENEDRLDVNPLHLGRFLKRMEGAYGSQRKLARALGKSPGWVQQRIALTELHPDLQKLVDGGEIKFELARACPRLASELQPLLAAGELPTDVAMAWLVTLKLKREEQLARFAAGSPFDIEPTREPVTEPAGTTVPADTTLMADPVPPSGEQTVEAPPPATDKPRPIVIRIAERNPVALAGALRKEFSEDEIRELVEALSTQQ